MQTRRMQKNSIHGRVCQQLRDVYAQEKGSEQNTEPWGTPQFSGMERGSFIYGRKQSNLCLFPTDALPNVFGTMLILGYHAFITWVSRQDRRRSQLALSSLFPGGRQQGREGCAGRLQAGVAVATDGRLSPRPAAEPPGGRH